jgi:low temperature requirement protein LtrA
MKWYKWAAFIIGILVLLAMLGITVSNHQSYESAGLALLVIFGLVVMLFILIGAKTRENERWMALLLLGILLLGFSALTIFSVGLFTTPIALFLTVMAVWKLVHKKAGLVG